MKIELLALADEGICLSSVSRLGEARRYKKNLLHFKASGWGPDNQNMRTGAKKLDAGCDLAIFGMAARGLSSGYGGLKWFLSVQLSPQPEIGGR